MKYFPAAVEFIVGCWINKRASLTSRDVSQLQTIVKLQWTQVL